MWPFDDDDKDLKRVLRRLLEICEKILAILVRARSFNIRQGDNMGAITGTPAGGISTFTAVPVQADGVTPGALQAGNVPAWSSSDPLVSITPSADGSSANVAVGAGDTNTSYPLTVSGVASDGTSISTTVTVPILSVTPPPPTPATGFAISQTA